MPADKPQHKKTERTQKPVSDTQIPVVKTKSKNTGKEQIRGNQTANDETRDNQPPVVSIDKIPKIEIIERDDADKIPKRANNISLASAIVNGLLLVCTLVLAGISYMQATSANNSAKIAQKTFEADTAYNNKNIREQKISNQKADVAESLKIQREIATFDLQKNALNAQINSVKDNEKEFKIQNTAYLEIDQIDTVFFKSTNAALRFNLNNLSGYPVQIISMNTVATVGAIDHGNDQIIKRELEEQESARKPQVDYSYLIKGTPKTGTIHFITNNATQFSVKNGFSSLYIFGNVVYKNLSDNEVRLYKYEIEFTIKPEGYKVIFAQNIPVK